MAIVVVNRGMFERDTSGHRTTNYTKATQTASTDQGAGGVAGTCRVVYEGIEYVWGPGEAKTFSDPGIASAVVTAAAQGGTGPLRVADTRDGLPKGGAS